MPGQGRFTAKQDRQAAHIKASEEKVGRTPKEAERIAYTTVQAQKKKGKK